MRPWSMEEWCLTQKPCSLPIRHWPWKLWSKSSKIAQVADDPAWPSMCGCSNSKGQFKGRASLVASMVKNPPAMRETWVRSLGWEDLLEEGMATHSSILAWRIPWTEEPGGLQSIGLQRTGHDWETKHNPLLKGKLLSEHKYCGFREQTCRTENW